MNGIILLAAVYWVENFKSCNKYLHILAKKIGLVTRNISVEILELQLEEILKSRELAKLEKLMSEKKDWFAETLQ